MATQEQYNRFERHGANSSRAQEPRHAPRVHLEWFNDIEPSEADWLVHEVMPQQGLGSLYAPSGAGKTFIALDWALRIAAGMRILNLPTEKVGVAYVATESPAGVRRRVKAWANCHQAEDLPFALIPNRLDLRAAASEDVTALIDELNDAQIEFREMGARLGLIVVDTFASATPGMPENSPEGMGAAIAALQRIAGETGAFVLIVHHTGKDEERGMRGHSNLLASLDTTIEVTHDRAGKTRAIHLRKQKDGEDNRALAAFSLKSIDIGVSRNGLPITSCIVEYEAAPADAPKKKPSVSSREQIVLKAMQQLAAEGAAVMPRPSHVPVSAFPVRLDDVRERARSNGLEGNGMTKDASRKAVGRAKESLIAKGLIAERDGLVWAL